MSKEISVKLLGPWSSVSGIGQCCAEIALALNDNGIETNLVNLLNFGQNREIEKDKLQKLKMIESKKLLNPYVAIHFYPLDRANVLDDKALANIFFTMYETNKIPYFWKLILNQKNVNEVWVPSEFNRQTFMDSGVDGNKIEIINLGIDLEKYNVNNKKLDNFSNKDNFYFSYISELKICKGYDVLLKAFFEEFKNEPKAKLIFKCTSGDNPKDIEKIVSFIKAIKGESKAELFLIYGNKNEDFMTSLYASADCFVLPTRGEGWSMGAIQSMASGIPVITTRCSAHMTYCNDENSMLVDTTLEKIKDIEWLKQVPSQNEHSWFEPNYNQLKQKMRYAYENRDKIKIMAEKARKDIEQYSWNNTSLQIIKQLFKYSDKL